MQRDVIVARVDEDQESVARKIDKYDLIAIPVVDATDMLVGIITHDDAHGHPPPGADRGHPRLRRRLEGRRGRRRVVLAGPDPSRPSAAGSAGS